jgi:hypothetical protein
MIQKHKVKTPPSHPKKLNQILKKSQKLKRKLKNLMRLKMIRNLKKLSRKRRKLLKIAQNPYQKRNQVWKMTI